MAMNFFEHQDQARRRTGRLVIYFGMAVVCIVVVLYITRSRDVECSAAAAEFRRVSE